MPTKKLPKRIRIDFANDSRVVRVKPITGRGFTIQTNGKLWRTHRDGVGPQLAAELVAYVTNFGTTAQKNLLA